MSSPGYPSLWNLAANPVFRRHTVSRLRPWRLAAWILVTQVVAGFAWATGALVYFHTRVRDPAAFEPGTPAFREMVASHGENGFLIGWLAVLVIQGLLLVVKGTFSVATGVAREANEGMIEAERLAPLPTGHKVIGQLLGLPVLEIAVAALLMVWPLLSVWLGGLPLAMMGKVYLILGTTALFHHAIGLVAGTLIQQKILAGTISQVLVILLHFVLPAARSFGIGLISHLGAEAAVLHEIADAVPRILQPHGPIAPSAAPGPVDFFRWEIAVSGYHWVLTVSMIGFLLAVLVRRWNDSDSQWLGKAGTFGFAAWILLLTCGEVLPRIARGEGMALATAPGGPGFSLHLVAAGRAEVGLAVWSATFAAALGVLCLGLTGTLAPSRDARARCAHLARVPLLADGRNPLPWVAAIPLLAAGVWSWVTLRLLHDTPGRWTMAVEAPGVLAVAAALLAPACMLHALVLWRGWKVAMMAGFLVWAVPLMTAALGLMMAARPDGWPLWLGGFSGLTLPAYGALAGAGGEPWGFFRPVFFASLAAHLAAAGVFLWLARRARR